MDADTDMLRPEDVMSSLHISRSHCYSLIAQGVIPSVRFGHTVRIPRGPYERWLKQTIKEAERSPATAASA